MIGKQESRRRDPRLRQSPNAGEGQPVRIVKFWIVLFLEPEQILTSERGPVLVRMDPLAMGDPMAERAEEHD